MRRLMSVLALVTLAAVVAAAAPGPDPDAPPPPPDAGPPDGPPPQGQPPPHRGGPGEHWRGRPGMRPGIFGPVTDEEIAQVLAFMGEFLPEIRADLEKMRDKDPQLFQAYMRRLRFEIRQLKSLRQQDEKAFQNAIEEKRLRHQSRDLAARWRASTDAAERDRLRAQLREVVGKLFDAELVTREAHLKRLEEQLKRLREELKASGTRRTETIEERLERLLNPPARPSDEEGPPPARES